MIMPNPLNVPSGGSASSQFKVNIASQGFTWNKHNNIPRRRLHGVHLIGGYRSLFDGEDCLG
jgi:hypothetical protein